MHFNTMHLHKRVWTSRYDKVWPSRSGLQLHCVRTPRLKRNRGKYRLVPTERHLATLWIGTSRMWFPLPSNHHRLATRCVNIICWLNDLIVYCLASLIQENSVDLMDRIPALFVTTPNMIVTTFNSCRQWYFLDCYSVHVPSSIVISCSITSGPTTMIYPFLYR